MMVKVINESNRKRFVLEGLGDIVIQERDRRNPFCNNVTIICPDMILEIPETASPGEVCYAMTNKVTDAKLEELITSLRSSIDHLLNDEDADSMIDKVESIIKDGKRMVRKNPHLDNFSDALDRIYICFDSLNEREMKNLSPYLGSGSVCGSSPDPTKSKYHDATELIGMNSDFRQEQIKMGIVNTRTAVEASIASMQDTMKLPLTQKLERLNLYKGISIQFVPKKKID